MDETIRIWDLDTAECLRAIAAGMRVWNLDVVRQHGWLVASGGRSAVIHVWDWATGTRVKTLDLSSSVTEVTNCVPMDDDPEAFLIGGYDDARLCRLNVVSGECKQVFQLAPPQRLGLSVAFSSTGIAVALSDCDDVVLVPSQSSARGIVLQGHADAVTHCAFSPDGTLLATCGMDGACHIWSADTGKLYRSLAATSTPKFINCCAFSSDGTKLVLASGDHAAQLWDVSPPFKFALLAIMAAGHRRQEQGLPVELWDLIFFHSIV